ncbi:MAG: hypothetical protein LBT00_14270 [Spirochaetaceae bacterium]|nr:hypothetical protein [Spirochaetaceae bacterium]
MLHGADTSLLTVYASGKKRDVSPPPPAVEALGRVVKERPSAPILGENAPRLDCFTLRVRNDDAPHPPAVETLGRVVRERPSAPILGENTSEPPVIASEAKQSSVTALPWAYRERTPLVWIASPFGFAMTRPPSTCRGGPWARREGTPLGPHSGGEHERAACHCERAAHCRAKQSRGRTPLVWIASSLRSSQ